MTNTSRYIILGKDGYDKKRDYWEPAFRSFASNMYLTKDGRLYFSEDAQVFVASSDGELEQCGGDVINDAFEVLGYDSFVNINDNGICPLRSVNIQTDAIGVILHNRVLYVAYKGYVFGIVGVNMISYIRMEYGILRIKTDVSDVIQGNRDGGGDFLFGSKGIKSATDEDDEDIVCSIKLLGRYKDGRAGVALAKVVS